MQAPRQPAACIWQPIRPAFTGCEPLVRLLPPHQVVLVPLDYTCRLRWKVKHCQQPAANLVPQSTAAGGLRGWHAHRAGPLHTAIEQLPAARSAQGVHRTLRQVERALERALQADPAADSRPLVHLMCTRTAGLCRCTEADAIRVVWSEDAKGPPPAEQDAAFYSAHKEVVYNVQPSPSLNHRFRPLSGLRTAAVLSVDDDVIVPCDEVLPCSIIHPLR